MHRIDPNMIHGGKSKSAIIFRKLCGPDPTPKVIHEKKKKKNSRNKRNFFSRLTGIVRNMEIIPANIIPRKAV